MFSLNQLIQESSQSESIRKDDKETDNVRGTINDQGSKKRPLHDDSDDDDGPSRKRERTAALKKNETRKVESEQRTANEKLKQSKDDDSLYNSEEGSVEEDESEDDGFQTNYSEAVGTLYSGNKNSSQQPTPDALKVANEALVPQINVKLHRRVISRVEKFQPRTRALRRAGKTFEVVTETAEDAAYRVHQEERHREYSTIRKKWKMRLIDYTKEEDVGGAVYAKARRLLDAKIRREVQQKKRKRIEDDRKREEEEKKKVEEEEEEDRQKKLKEEQEEDDESVKEQNVLLDKLTQDTGETDVEEQEEDRLKEVTKRREEASIPYKNRMNFWAYGKSRPYEKDLEFDWFRERELISREVDDEEDDDEKGSKVAFNDLRVSGSGAGENSCQWFYFPLNTTKAIGGTLGSYAHYRHLRCMAVRYLCGGAGDIELENRIVRSLWSKLKIKEERDPESSNTKRSLLFLTMQQGANALTFLQHNWSDPMDVAKQLGLVEGGLITVMAGRTMKPKSVQSFLQNRRKDVKKKFQRGVKPLIRKEYVGSEEVEVGNGDVLESDDNDSDDGGHENYDKNQIFDQSSGSESLDALVCPTTMFAYLPGMTPPIPLFPLDPITVIFGPVDRYAKFYHKAATDEVAYNLTISTFLSRMARTRLQQDDSYSSKLGNIQHQLSRFMQENVKIKHSNYYKLCTSLQYGKVRDLPLVPYYRALMSYCSYYANGQPQQTSIESSDGETLSSDDDDLYEEDNFHQIADDIYKVCQKRINHNGLIRFPRLRVPYALALVCRSLPSSAAEILSRPINGEECRTPLDLIKHTMEHMEEKQMISEGKKFLGDGSVLYQELEYLMHDAAEIFDECVKVDWVNVDYHLWRIGALAACLLLCSGNEIGSSARLFPSARKKGNLRHVLGSSVSHEVRPMMQKYKDVRLRLSAAIRLLFVLARHQASPQVHLAISSLLEWRQVIALLVGKSLRDSSDDIQKIHRYHLIKWGLESQSSCAKQFMKRQQENRNLTFLAEKLEDDPGKIEHWRRFVTAIGPLGSSNDIDCGRAHRAECSECRCLRGTRVIDHMKRQKSGWWGTRRGWWVWGLLQMESLRTSFVRKHTRAEMVMQKLEDLGPEIAPDSTFHDVVSDHDEFEASRGCQVRWLPSKRAILSEKGEQSDDERSSLYDSELPEPFLDAINQPEHNVSLSSPQLPALSGSNAARLEILCYKILIFCHMRDLTHENVEGYLYPLVMANIEISKSGSSFTHRLKIDCDEFRVLLWLFSMGLDVPHVVREHYSRRSKTVLLKKKS